MENLNLILLICLIIPMSMMLTVFKGHSRMLCAFLLAGMFMCVFSGEINGLIASVYGLDTQSIAVNVSPLVEEIAKAIPIIFTAFLIKPTSQKLAEFSIAIGVGFATLENMCILLSSGNISFGYALFRAIGAGMMHGICTLIVGLAMKNVVEKKMVFFSGTLSALSVAVIYHSIYNMLISSRFMAAGIVLPVLTFAIIIIVSTAKNKKSEKQDKEKING